MSSDSRSKVQALHLKRNAYVYIRHSSPRQVLENVERQYDLRQRAADVGILHGRYLNRLLPRDSRTNFSER